MICLTERLYVRQFQMTDLDVFAALCADAVVLRYVGDGTPLTRSEVANWIQICEQKYANRRYGTSAVFTRSDDRFIGYCGVVRAPNNDFDELVYVFHSDVWGQGFATEVATAMLDYVFSISALTDIYATIDPLNTASIGVVKKLGFEYDRAEMDGLGPVAFYRLSRIQWLSLRV
ncbi:MAG: GNAT family N-acetyltransferase [SAR86 cluster bacterium]|tara:strand:+ start:10946 stop:11467 length:522 start_codon:yes stop_codon:yes gene_type:complete